MEASALRAPAGLAPRRPGGVLLRLRSDDQLVALFRQGNEDAFRLIHDRYRQRLSAYARQMLGGSATDADDAMQDVFLRAYAALRADDRPVTLRAWLYRVAHNRCIDHIRRPASQPTVELSESARPLPATTGDPIVAAERREDLRRLVLDVRALPEQQRSALLMREMEGLSYQELAAALDVTIPAVKSLLVRARMGLVESQQARDTPCQAIREDIVSAHDRGVRASGRARRHVRECPGCAGYRATLRGISGGLSALDPSPGPWTAIAKLIGIGAGGSGAAGGAAAAGVGVGGAAATATAGSAGGAVIASAAATKLAAVVAAAALVGGSVEVAREQAAPPPRKAPVAASAVHAAALPAAAARAAAAAATTAANVRPADRLRPPASEKAWKARRRGARRATPVTAPDPSVPLLPAAGAVVPASHDGGAEAPTEDTTAGTATDDASGLAGLLGGLGGSSSTTDGDHASTTGQPGAGADTPSGSSSTAGSTSSTDGSSGGGSSSSPTASGAQVSPAAATGAGTSGGGSAAPTTAAPSGGS